MQENVYDTTSNCIEGYNVSVFETEQSDVVISRYSCLAY